MVVIKTLQKRSLKEIFELEYELPATYNTELDKYLKKLDNKNGYKFMKVIMKDQIYKTKFPNKFFCIINYDTSDKSGSHWIAIVRNGDVMYHFGSYGIPPMRAVTDKFTTCKIYYNDRAVQVAGTSICGHLCLNFIEYMIQKNAVFGDYIIESIELSNRYKKERPK